MSNQEILPQHLQVCDELYQLAHEENRHLKEHRRAPGADLLERKRALLARLDSSLATLRGVPAGRRDQRPLAARIRDRIMQLLQLDKENEQLLLRVSLSRGIDPAATPVPPPPPAMLRRIYRGPGE